MPGIFAPQTSAVTTGLIASQRDPAAQLLAQDHNAMVLPIETTACDLGSLQSLIITSQQRFLASAHDLINFPGAIQLVLRNQTDQETHEQWHTGVEMCLQALMLFPKGQVEVTTLSDALAGQLASDFGLSARSLEPRGTARTTGQIAHLDPQSGTIKIAGQNDRLLHHDAQNWHRLTGNLCLDTEANAAPDLADLLRYAKKSPRRPRPDPAKAQSLFVVSNGVGLGHLTRLLAVALELRKSGETDPVFWCYSRAAGLLQAHGFAVILRQTAAHLDADRAHWMRWETKDLARYIRQNPVSTVVYDGSNIAGAIAKALREPGCGNCGLIWVRRGMWQSHWNADVLEAAELCDLVLEPGDIASSFDTGPTATYPAQFRGYSEHRVTSPVILVQEPDLLKRRVARKALGIRGRKLLCLINLGAHAIASHARLTATIENSRSNGDIHFLWARSPLADPGQTLNADIPQISEFPLGRYLNAFDGIISAAGYNSFHEAMALCQAPVLFAPSVHSRLDDQVSRALFAASTEQAQVLNPAEGAGSQDVLQSFFGQVAERAITRRPAFETNGAAQMAQSIIDVQTRYICNSNRQGTQDD